MSTIPAAERIAAVAFCADQYMEAPLHVAASSLLRNLRADYTARFYFLLTGFSEAAIARLRRTLNATGRTYTMKILGTHDTGLFRGFRPLHGNLAPYYRLLLPELVQEERLLYLDADTRIELDVSPLFELEMGSKATGFVVSGTVSSALDGAFHLSIGRDAEAPAFNSGVMLFNLPEWRRQDCSARTFAFGRKYSTELISHDQSILNALFAENCLCLDPRYNVQVLGTTAPEAIPANGVFHFVGNPKPWDIGGRLLLPHAGPWFDDLRKTAIPPLQRISWLNWTAWARIPGILGGYRRILRKKLARD